MRRLASGQLHHVRSLVYTIFRHPPLVRVAGRSGDVCYHLVDVGAAVANPLCPSRAFVPAAVWMPLVSLYAACAVCTDSQLDLAMLSNLSRVGSCESRDGCADPPTLWRSR